MTKAQYLKNCKALKKDVNECIDDQIKKALDSGAIDLKDYEDNFLLPAIVMSAIMGGLEKQYKPLGKQRETVENLKHFL